MGSVKYSKSNSTYHEECFNILKDSDPYFFSAQQIIDEADGLTTEEKTPLYLSKMARGELK